MSTTTIASPSAPTAVADDHPDTAVRRRLAEAPAGAYATLEAALAWHLARPGGARHRLPARSRYLPVADTVHEDAAARLARLLSTLAWAIVTGGADEGRFRVEVPRMHYHRVTRALTAAWREAPAETTVVPDAAAALWRMAILIGGLGSRRGAIRLRVGPPAVAGMLLRAGAGLGVTPILDQTPRGSMLVVGQHRDVQRLLREVGAGPAAWLWTATAS
jgi:hypothetical protein